jgi:hypothetical protein
VGPIIGATRLCRELGNPIWRSRPRGAATSRAKYCPTVRPVTGRMTPLMMTFRTAADLVRLRPHWSHIGHSAAIAPVPLRVKLDRSPKITAVEIRPQSIKEHQFGVCALPEQEV